MGKPYPLKFFKGCLPQNLLSPVLNTLSHILKGQSKEGKLDHIFQLEDSFILCFYAIVVN